MENKELVERAAEIATLLRSNGESCTCSAYASFECGCEATWSEDYTSEAADIITMLVAELAKRPLLNTANTALSRNC